MRLKNRRIARGLRRSDSRCKVSIEADGRPPMGMNPIHPAILPATSGTASLYSDATEREIVSAVRSLNRPEFLGSGRELRHRRDRKTGRIIVEILERETGEVVDEIAPETLLEIRKSFATKHKEEDSQE